MQIIPAMDIIAGQCVRLVKGVFSEKTVYSHDPETVAASFEAAGLSRLHLVDLDGARMGAIQNLNVLKSIARNTDLSIDFGGGIKTTEDVQQVYDAGAAYIAVGSVAVKNPDLLASWVSRFGADKILVGADVLDGIIKINGWQEDSGVSLHAFLQQMTDIGIRRIFSTDISKDGMMDGPSIALYQSIRSQFPDIEVIGSGGVATVDVLEQLKKAGCAGVIVGKAIYEGTISLEELADFNQA